MTGVPFGLMGALAVAVGVGWVAQALHDLPLHPHPTTTAAPPG